MRKTAHPSIARRIYRAMLLVSGIGMLAMTGMVLFISDDLEDSILALEMHRERNVILANHDLAEPLFWNSAELIAVYVPRGQPPPTDLPALFRGMPAQYSDEIETDGQTWLLAATPTETGQLYLAKNITHFEEREALFEQILFAVACAIMGLSLLLAAWSSRRLIRPLRYLSHTIENTPVGPAMPRIAMDGAPDAELHAIAVTFNRFLDELEAYVHRERSLLNMAGHELRTPIAVLSGALDVLEVRGQLSARDRTTLTRARRACDDMRENVNTLLALARRDARESLPSGGACDPPAADLEAGMRTQRTADADVDLNAIVQRVADDLGVGYPDRLALDLRAERAVKTDAVMARMLLHNLMQNALQHTRQRVHVTVTDDGIEVADQGAGLDARAQRILRGEGPPAPALGGLGLYIVTLMSERLGWMLDIAQTGEGGTRIRLRLRLDGSSAGAAPPSGMG